MAEDKEKPQQEQATQAQGQARGRPAQPSKSHMLGEMVWLLSQSPVHKGFPLEELHWFVLPPLSLQQYRVFLGRADEAQGADAGIAGVDVPMGLALWAMFSEEVEKRFCDNVKADKGPLRLKPEDWNSGDRLWLIDLIAPYSTPENKQVQLMMKDFVENGLGQVFPKAHNHTLKFFQNNAETGERKIMEIKAEIKMPSGEILEPQT